MSATGTPRVDRIKRLNTAIEALSEAYEVPVVSYSRTRVRTSFAATGALTKWWMATSIAKRIPAFERYVPPIRKPWMSEDARMGLFDAASLAMTFLADGSDEKDICYASDINALTEAAVGVFFYAGVVKVRLRGGQLLRAAISRSNAWMLT
jgi:hypothetical protein